MQKEEAGPTEKLGAAVEKEEEAVGAASTVDLGAVLEPKAAVDIVQRGSAAVVGRR